MRSYLSYKNEMHSRLIFLLFLFPCFNVCFGQPNILRGYVYEQDSCTPIISAHIRVVNSNYGTITGMDGSFSLQVKLLPLILEISCLGHETISLEISKIQKEPLFLFLKPKAYDLTGVTISDKAVSPLFKDENYSVLDYNFLGDYLILLVFRYQLRWSEIVLMTTDGDTLTVVPVPAGSPFGFYKDVFSNVHYITKKKDAFQCVYFPDQEQLCFPYRTSYDTILRFLGGYRFLIGNRLYFQEDSPRGFMTCIGYYSRMEGRKYTHRSEDFIGMKTYYADAGNYHTFRPVPNPIDEHESRGVDADSLAYRHFFMKKSCGELFRIKDSLLAFFDFCKNRIELIDKDDSVIKTSPIDFHLDKNPGLQASFVNIATGNDNWKWSYLLQDEFFHTIFAIYTRNGFVRLKKIDPETGSSGLPEDLPYIFPEKIKIFRGEAYFLAKDSALNEKRKLYKIAIE